MSGEFENRRAAQPARGLLRHGRARGFIDRHRLLPSAALAPFIHHLWAIEWDLETPFDAEALPHPVGVLRFELDPEEGARAEFVGVQSARIVKRLTGTGRSFGITFRPATFQQLLRAPMSTFTDRAVPLARIFGNAADDWGRRILAAASLDEQLQLAEGFLAPRLAPNEKDVERIRDMVERLMLDRSLIRVDDVAQALELRARALQRRFLRYVGVSPKWVIQRYRLHEAAELLKSAPSGSCSDAKPISLAELAASLGYADQSHFAREFKRVVGRSPLAYRKELER